MIETNGNPENETVSGPIEQNAQTPVRGDTDQQTGEYHYSNGYSEKIYSDAHYEPAGESTVPPRYYTPPEKTVKEAKPKKENEGRKGLGFAPILCLCLVCALLGGLLGGALVGQKVNDRVAALQESVTANTQAIEEAAAAAQEQETSGIAAAVNGTVTQGETLAPSAVYARALNQVVGISTEVTYTNFFGQTSSSAVSGSGFIISKDGYILTNYHVIEYAYEGKNEITVMTYDGTSYKASIVGVEPGNDIAVLKIDADDLEPVTFGNSGSLSVGETIYAVGNPLGELEFSMATGTVSALDRVISTQESESINMFQIDAAVNPGNSGGPVYNTQGQVVGIVTAKYSETDVEGLGFAIPINDATAIANDLMTTGYVTGKAFMGIEPDGRYNSMYASYWNAPMGVFVKSVIGGTAAETAGIQANDIIVKLGDYEISDYASLKQALKNFSAGDTTEVTVFRFSTTRPGEFDQQTVTGEEITLNITFDEQVPDDVSSAETESADAESTDEGLESEKPESKVPGPDEGPKAP